MKILNSFAIAVTMLCASTASAGEIPNLVTHSFVSPNDLYASATTGAVVQPRPCTFVRFSAGGQAFAIRQSSVGYNEMMDNLQLSWLTGAAVIIHYHEANAQPVGAPECSGAVYLTRVDLG